MHIFGEQGGSPASTTIVVTKDATSGALFFDGSAIPSDFTINEGDIYIFDTSDSSMTGYSIGFAGSKDNSGNNALGSSDGVTISGVPGSAGAKTTVQLAANYGDQQNCTSSWLQSRQRLLRQLI